jgi:hypothetical protein
MEKLVINTENIKLLTFKNSIVDKRIRLTPTKVGNEMVVIPEPT